MCPRRRTVAAHMLVWRATRSKHDLCAWFDLHRLITVDRGLMGGTYSNTASVGFFEETPRTLDLQPGKTKAVACVTCGQIT